MCESCIARDNFVCTLGCKPIGQPKGHAEGNVAEESYLSVIVALQHHSSSCSKNPYKPYMACMHPYVSILGLLALAANTDLLTPGGDIVASQHCFKRVRSVVDILLAVLGCHC